MNENIKDNKEINSIYKEAKRILKLLQSIEKNATNYTLIIEGLKADTKNVGKEKPKVFKLVTDIEKQSGIVKGLSTKIHSLVSDTQKIKNEVDDIFKALKTDSKTSTTFIEKINKLKTELEETKKNIVSFASDSQKNSLKIQTLLIQAEKNDLAGKDIIKYLKGAENNARKSQSELAEILIKGKEDFIKISTSKKDVENLESSSKKFANSIQKYYDDLFRESGTKETITEIERTIKANQSLIDQQLDISSANRLCGMLDKYGKILKKTKDNWGIMIFTLVIVILIFNILPIILPIIESTKGININFGNFLGIELTLSFALIFTTLQYSSIKRQYEEYAFKYIAAFSLPAYLELLEGRDEVVYAKFLTDTISEIYKKPSSESKDNLVEHIFDILKSLLGKKIDLNSIVKDISDEKIDELVKLFKSKL